MRHSVWLHKRALNSRSLPGSCKEYIDEQGFKSGQIVCAECPLPPSGSPLKIHHWNSQFWTTSTLCPDVDVQVGKRWASTYDNPTAEVNCMMHGVRHYKFVYWLFRTITVFRRPQQTKTTPTCFEFDWIVTKNVSVRTYLKKRPRLRHPRFFLPGPFFSTRWAGHKNISTSTQAGTRVTRWDLTKPAPNSPTDGR